MINSIDPASLYTRISQADTQTSDVNGYKISDDSDGDINWAIDRDNLVSQSRSQGRETTWRERSALEQVLREELGVSESIAKYIILAFDKVDDRKDIISLQDVRDFLGLSDNITNKLVVKDRFCMALQDTIKGLEDYLKNNGRFLVLYPEETRNGFLEDIEGLKAVLEIVQNS